ncbi:ABC transporter permease [Pseudonocardia xishanensis]|uniref:ABC3 transporter permease C-terminal domain-containing protein n=1 Tax=Pseudonocardia xishanensis TaxID=630995 RepID=A0ABP8S1H2_9PSEU
MSWPGIVAVARAELRVGWRALLALGLVAGLVGGLLLGAAVVADRTGSAYPRLVDRTGLDDVRAYLPADLPEVTASFAGLPGVEESWTAYAWIAQIEGPTLQYTSVIAGPDRQEDLVNPVIVAGRAPRVEAADELLVGEPLAAAAGLRVGDRITLKMLTLRQVARFDVGFGEPEGATRRMTVVGIGRMPSWSGPLGDALSTPAFAAQNAGAAGGRSGFARLAYTGDPAADEALRDRLVGALAQEYVGRPRPLVVGNYVPEVPVFPTTQVDPAVAASERVLRLGLWGFALVVALGGTVVLGQGLMRHHLRGGADQRVENALGLDGAERATARVLAALAGAVPAALVAGSVTVAAGVIEPIGSQARFEPDSGFRVDWPVVLLGVVGVLAVFLGAAAVTSALAGRGAAAAPALTRHRSVRWAVRWPALFVGLRLALRGRTLPGGASGLPAFAAAAGVAVTVAGIVASTMLGASLQRLVDTPERYGFTSDLTIADARDAEMRVLAADPRVAALSEVETGRVTLDPARSRQVDAYAHVPVKGDVPVSLVTGRLPLAAGEVALGARVAGREEKAIGDTVDVLSSDGRSATLTVTGIVVPQPERGAPLGEGLIITPEQLDDLFRQPLASAHLVAVPGQSTSLYEDVGRRLEVHLPGMPPEIDTLAGLLRLPEILAGLLAVVAMAGLVHTLVGAVRRHSRDAAVLAVLGATPGQVRAALGVLATTTVLPGVAAGVLLGLGVGRVLWWQVASQTGVAPDVAVPIWPIVLIVPAVLVGSLVLGALPALRLARTPVARSLHGA